MPRWVRRAQPLLGTLVEIGVHAVRPADTTAFDAAFAALHDVQRCLSRFEPRSDIARFNALPRGGHLTLQPASHRVLLAAQELFDATDGDFDITLGSAPCGWRLVGDTLVKLAPEARLDLGGIGKGHAVDCAVQALLEHACTTGWVNAGGDMRAFGDADVPVQLRDEVGGGVRPFASVREGALATSHFDRGTRSQIATGERARKVRAHVSVAAPLCLWADALTKVVAIGGDAAHPLLARYDATAWLH